MPLNTLRFAAVCGIVALAIAGATAYWARSLTGADFFEGPSAPATNPEPMAASVSSEAPTNSLEPVSKSMGQRASRGPANDRKSEAALLGGILSGDGPIVDRLLTASSTYGEHDYRVRRAFGYARSLCASPDPSGSLALPMPDPSRDWVFESIANLCVGMETLQLDESVRMVGEPESLLSINRSRGQDAAVAAAEELMAHESDPVLVLEAALFAWEAGRSPSPASMGVNPDSVGPSEQLAAISDAVQLAACNQPGTCGPESWQTLAFCVRFGCAQGSSLREAMRAHHSGQRMRLVEGYAWWIQSFRGG